jgi:hypothetical protein
LYRATTTTTITTTRRRRGRIRRQRRCAQSGRLRGDWTLSPTAARERTTNAQPTHTYAHGQHAPHARTDLRRGAVSPARSRRGWALRSAWPPSLGCRCWSVAPPHTKAHPFDNCGTVVHKRVRDGARALLMVRFPTNLSRGREYEPRRGSSSPAFPFPSLPGACGRACVRDHSARRNEGGPNSLVLGRSVVTRSVGAETTRAKRRISRFAVFAREGIRRGILVLRRGAGGRQGQTGWHRPMPDGPARAVPRLIREARLGPPSHRSHRRRPSVARPDVP